MSYRAAVAHRILVIEDDETIAHAVAERLRSEAFVVDVASDGLEGVAHAARLRPDLCASTNADERNRVFERFYRADHAPVNHRGGAGLGLAIVRWIVELHGGTIRAEANSPRGCRMVIVLPRRQETPT
jgi:hypothetical protein